MNAKFFMNQGSIFQSAIDIKPWDNSSRALVICECKDLETKKFRKGIVPRF